MSERSAKDWNYDIIFTAQARLFDVQNDMMRSLHRGELSSIVRDRMVAQLKSTADDISKLTVNI